MESYPVVVIRATFIQICPIATLNLEYLFQVYRLDTTLHINILLAMDVENHHYLSSMSGPKLSS
jgi:hypothetical protein